MNFKRSTLLVLLLCGFLLADAQQFDYITSAPYEQQPDDVEIAVSPSGEIFLGETLDLENQFAWDTYRVRNATPNTSNPTVYDVGGYVRMSAIEATDDKVFLTLDFYQVDDYPVQLPGIGTIDTGDDQYGALVLAFDHELNLLWYEYFSSGFLNGFIDSDIIIRNNGNVMFNVGLLNPEYAYYYELREYTPDGDSVNALFQTELVYTVQEDSEDNIYVTGPCAQQYANFNGTPDTLTFDYNFYVAKYNSDFEYQWSNLVTEITCSFPDIEVTSDDRLYIAVAMLNGDYYFDDHLISISLGQFYALAEINTETGAFEWAEVLCQEGSSYGTVQNFNNGFFTSDGDGNLYLCTNTGGTLLWNNGQETLSDYSSPTLVKIAENGIVEWINHAEESSNQSNIQRLEYAESGCLIVGGTSAGLLQLDTVSTQQEGFYSFVARMPLESTATDIDNTWEPSLSIFPNPATDRLTIDYPDYNGEPFSIKVITVNGQLLMEETLAGRKNHLDISQLPEGVYLMQAGNEDILVTKRLIKVR